MKLAILTLIVALSGCADHHRIAQDARNRGDLRSEEHHLSIAARQGDGAAWNDLGVLYTKQGRQQLAVEAFIMGARYGDPTARRNLAARNLAIPAADLAARRTDALAEGLNAFTQGYTGTRPSQEPNVRLEPSGPSSATCDARQTSMGRGMNQTFQINCR